MNEELNVGELLGEVEEILLNTREQCQMIDGFIKNQINVKDEQINKLYTDLDKYKSTVDDKYTEQLMKSLIKIRTDLQRTMLRAEWNEMTADELRKQYTYIFEDITDLLEQQGIDSYKTENGMPFDASIHQPKIEITGLKELDKTVKNCISEGYKKGSKVLIPERVVVYQFNEK